MNISAISALAKVDPKAAEEKIRGALKRTSGDIGKAACNLGVSRMTLYRLMRSRAAIRRYVLELKSEGA